MEDELRVGVVSSMHGVRGEVKVFPTTEDVQRFLMLKQVFCETKNKRTELFIEQVKFFKQYAILKFRGIDNRDEAEALRGGDLLISRKDALPLMDGEYFICDIIGALVQAEDGEHIGILKDVLQTGANDVYVVEKIDGKELLLPCIPECILAIDTEKKLVKAYVMPGL